MVVLHFAITDKNKQVKFQIDILSREDATDNEREAAKAIEELLMDIIKAILNFKVFLIKITAGIIVQGSIQTFHLIPQFQISHCRYQPPEMRHFISTRTLQM